MDVLSGNLPTYLLLDEWQGTCFILPSITVDNERKRSQAQLTIGFVGDTHPLFGVIKYTSGSFPIAWRSICLHPDITGFFGTGTNDPNGVTDYH